MQGIIDNWDTDLCLITSKRFLFVIGGHQKPKCSTQGSQPVALTLVLNRKIFNQKSFNYFCTPLGSKHIDEFFSSSSL
jgi:hypothetical protein